MTKGTLAFWLTAVTAAWSAPALAGEVNGLTTFTAGTPAVASEVNGNFDAVATAVNDNDARLATAEGDISALEADLDAKQDRVTGTCAAGTAMSQVGEDGSVTCTPLTADGAAAVMGYALAAASFSGPHICGMRHLGPWSYFSSDPIEVSNSGCTAAAPISLPHGATLTSLSCRVNDDYASGSISISLNRHILTAVSGGGNIFVLTASADGGEALLTDTTALGGTDVVNNVDYAYHLTASYDLDSPAAFFTIDDDLAVAGCSVTYTAE